MKKNDTSQIKKDSFDKLNAFIVLAVIVSCLLLGWNYFNKKSKKTLPVVLVHAPTEPTRLASIILKPTLRSQQVAKKLLKTSLGPSAIEKSSLEYLNKIMLDNNVDTFFRYSLDFFKYKKEAYPVARLVALTLVFNESPEHMYLMNRTLNEIKGYSKEIAGTLQQKKNEIFANPYFHNRMLNLVNKLEIPAEKKLEFYSDTLARPLLFSENGNLSERSQILEVALILSKQTVKSSSEVAPIIARSIASNSDPAQKQALQTRVLNYYPELNYLFR